MNSEAIKNFILTDIIRDSGVSTIAANDNLIDSGVINSLGIMKIVSFLESNFKISISDDEILLDNFESLDAITQFVESKLS